MANSDNSSDKIDTCESDFSHKPDLLSVRIITAGLTIALFGLFAGGFYFWDRNNFVISPSSLYTLIFSGLIVLAGSLMRLRAAGSRNFFKNLYFCPESACIGLLLLFFSDWLCRGFNLFQGPAIRGELLAVLLINLLVIRKISGRIMMTGTILICLTLFSLFIAGSGGYPIMSDDHASFIFRLTLLKEKFPDIPFYHPWWNAGLDARDFFATGALAFFFVTAPLHYLFSIADSYNISAALILFILLPFNLACACRILRLPSPTSSIAAILGLATSLVWYRWGLKYGTMGFVTSAALMPLVFSLGCRIISNQRLSRLQLALFIICGSIACMWPLGAACYIGLALLALFRIRSIINNRQILIAGALMLAINIPWAIMFWKVSKVGSFLQAPRTEISYQQDALSNSAAAPAFRHKNAGFNIEKTLKALREQANGTNPLILFLFLPGLCLLGKEYGKAFMIQTAIMAFAGSVLVTMLPQLELDRLLVFLGILLAIPVARSLTYMLKESGAPIIIPAFAFSFLFLTPFTASNVILNRSAEAYQFGDGYAEKLLTAIDSNLGSGRALFSGFVLHELNGGHLAPLSVWLKKPLVASSPFHNRWKYSSVFPDNFIAEGENGVSRFLDLMNAEIVLAHEHHWREYFMKRQDQFDLVWHERPFMMFRRKNFVSNYFLEGSGEIIEQSIDSVRIKISSTDAVIKFAYYPFLQAGSCRLEPFDAGLETALIRLTGCQAGSEFLLESVSPLKRLLQ